MKKLYFNNYTSITNITMMSVAIAAILVNLFFKSFIESNGFRWYIAIAYILMIYVFGKIVIFNLFFKNLISYNSTALQIRVSTLTSVILSFSNILSYSLNENGILIIKEKSKKYEFDLSIYRFKDRKRFLAILNKYVKSKK